MSGDFDDLAAIAQPPTYSEVSHAACTYVDIHPRCLKKSGFASDPVYETFP